MRRDLKILVSEYEKKKPLISRRLFEFAEVWRKSDQSIFSELCFCICTPQSKAVYCDKAVSGLEKTGVLFGGSLSQIRAGLKAVRFPNNKARFLLHARGVFSSEGSISIKDRIDPRDIPGTRERFVRDVKGIGFKEASHFLRNIGFGKDLAILDVHILKNMIRLGIIKERPKTLTRNSYLELENKFRIFAKKIGISMDALDLLFWSRETGEIFK